MTYTAADLDAAYHRGVQDERERAAAAQYEAALIWERDAATIHTNRKQALLRLFEQCAHRFHERELGRPYKPWMGVDV